MKRILFFGMTENPGGVESFLLNYYRHIDRNRIQFDFLCNTYQPVAYEEELKQLGARVYHITPRSENWYRFDKELKQLFRERKEDWDGIWVNVNSLANIDYLIHAKRAGIRKRIIHSHNSFDSNGKIRRVLHEVNKRRLHRYATDFWACSEEAARWFFNDSELRKAVIIHNAIDAESKRFDQEKRDRIRKQYGLDGCFVIGNVGRMHIQKNQEFLIDVFAGYHALNPQSRLVIIGQGAEEANLREKAKSLHLSESILFPGPQTDIQAWLSSFDLFCFPSRFEGFGIATLEAEANGLPVLASDCAMSEELRLNTNVRVLSLNQDISAWIKNLAELAETGREKDPEQIISRISAGGYDVKTETAKLEKLLM